ncbi:MAG: hypothetical protein WCT49_00200 [Candidatus Paceibacterota bacterium]|jgi:hypothetical protein|nr:hypothetical protein [Candidatus Paceibacterota bacterium]
MLSSKVKRIIARIFLVLVITPVLFTMSAPWDPDQSVAHAQGINSTAAPDPIGFINCVTNLGPCIIVYSAYFLFIKVPSWLAEFASLASNALFAYGLNSSSYQQDNLAPDRQFINIGWVICRDVANTFFIFILLYIAIMTILGKLSGQTKKLLMSVIVVALFMNFSMYITRFIVDVGNMVAIEFYNAFPDESGLYIDFNGIEQHNITGGFLHAVLIPVQDALVHLNLSQDHWAWIAFVYFLCGVLMIIFIFVMLAASFLMIGRVAMIWALMIISPLAFFSYATPQFSSKFGAWLSELTKQVFFPAPFLFFVYIASRLVQATGTTFRLNTGTPNAEQGALTALIPAMLQIAIVGAFLMYGLKMATGMAGQAGAAASKYLSMGTGAALGFGAMAMRGGVGRSAQYLQDKWEREGRIDNMKTSIAGRFALSSLDKAQNSSFDIRNTGGFKQAAGNAGLNLGVGTAKTYAQKQKEGDDEKLKTFQSLKTDQQKIAYLKSVYSPNIMGKGPTHPLDFGVSTRKIMASLPVNERLKLIESAKDGDDKQFMRQLNADLGEINFSPPAVVERYKSLEGDPKKQAALIAGLRNESIDANGNKVRGRTDDEMRAVLKGMTEKERAQIEANLRTSEVKAMQADVAEKEKKLSDKNLGAEERTAIEKQLEEVKEQIKSTDYGAIKELNTAVFAKLKPLQQDAAKIERRNFEKEEGFREARNDLKDKLAKYSALTEADQEKTREEVTELVKKMGDNRIATLEEEDLANPLVAKHLTKTQLEKINRSNTLNLTDEHWAEIKEAVKNGVDQKAKEYLDLAPKNATADRKTTEEKPQWTWKEDGKGKRKK